MLSDKNLMTQMLTKADYQKYLADADIQSLPEVVVTPSNRKDPNGNYYNANTSYYNSAFRPEDAIKFMNTATLGGLNNLSLSQWARRLYDTGEAVKGNMTLDDYVNAWFNGNNDIVSDKFAAEHPYISTGINLATDLVAPFAGYKAYSKFAAPTVSTSDTVNGVTKLPYRTPSTFKSELDWSPESWFGTRAKGAYDPEDVLALKSHIPEYLTIEQQAKADGTWLKMSDGAIWQGDPRSWVQMQSKAYKDAQLTGIPHYSGIDLNTHPISYTPEYNGDSWTDLDQGMSKNWSGIGVPGHNGHIFELDYPLSSKELTVDAEGRIWNNLPVKIFLEEPGMYNKTTEDLVEQSARHGYNVTRINNVVEGFSEGKPVTDVIIHEGTPRKSLIGNNGDFNLANPNIYKGLLYPFGIGLTVDNVFQTNENGIR